MGGIAQLVRATETRGREKSTTAYHAGWKYTASVKMVIHCKSRAYLPAAPQRVGAALR